MSDIALEVKTSKAAVLTSIKKQGPTALLRVGTSEFPRIRK